MTAHGRQTVDELPASATGGPGSVAAAVRGRKLGFNVSMLAGSQAVTWSLTLLWTVIVPRLLGPSGMGEIVAATSVAAILGVVLGLGTKTYLVREIVVVPERAPSLIATSIMLRIYLIPAFVGAVLIYRDVAHLSSSASLILYLATGAAFLSLLTEPVQAAFQAFERMEYLAYSNVATSSLQILIGVSLALIGFRARGLMAASIIIVGVVLVLNVLWLRRHIRITLHTTVRQMRALVTDSLAYWSLGLFYMIYLWIDSVILSLMTNPSTVGWYGVSTRLFTTLMFVPVIMSTAWLPRLISAFEEAPERLHEVARRPIELILLLGLPICVVTAVTAGPVIKLLYGPGYRQAAPVLVILAFVAPLMYLNIMLNQLVVAAKRQSIWTWIMAGATVVNPVLNVVLIPIFRTHTGNGATGAAVALGLTEVLIVVVGLVIVGRKVLTRSSVSLLVRGVVAAGSMWAVMYATRPFGFVGATVAGSAVFVALAFLLRLISPSEMTSLRLAARRALGRFGHDRPERSASPQGSQVRPKGVVTMHDGPQREGGGT